MQVKREVLSYLLEELGNQRILFLFGARQVGKTSLMQELANFSKKKNKTIKYYNLELPNDSRYFAQDTADLYESLTKNVDYIFIDEFHYLKNATKLFKAIYDDTKLNIKIIASGSSAIEMHKHLKESLAGRKKNYIIRPLSFLESKQANTSFEDYLCYGGYPGLIHEDTNKQKIFYLNELVKSLLMKDIKALINEESIGAFNNMIYSIAFNQGQVISANNLAKDYRLSQETVERYLEILTQTYIIHKIPSYSKNLSNELKKSKKYYFYDIGMRNSIINDFEQISTRKDKGYIYEQYVCNFLIKNSTPNCELRFWRTRNDDEIDFVLLKNNKPYIFEVKSKLKNTNIPDAMKIFIRNYRDLQGAYIINETISATIEFEGVSIEFIKLIDLEQSSILEIFEI
ncbi:MAG: ATP-binding protein [Candidatus Caenarcaniphilales bacterium]|jgi:hypothetical protein|nr:ATP-binding protein [Candidatus Caenarcaniphilales bacterium]